MKPKLIALGIWGNWSSSPIKGLCLNQNTGRGRAARTLQGQLFPHTTQRTRRNHVPLGAREAGQPGEVLGETERPTPCLRVDEQKVNQDKLWGGQLLDTREFQKWQLSFVSVFGYQVYKLRGRNHENSFQKCSLEWLCPLSVRPSSPSTLPQQLPISSSFFQLDPLFGVTYMWALGLLDE